MTEAPRSFVAAPTRHGRVLRQHEVDSGTQDGVGSEARERIECLAREVKVLPWANEILALVDALFAQAELDRCLNP